MAIAQDRIGMGFRVHGTHRVQLRLKASIECDLEIAEIRLSGPGFGQPVSVLHRCDADFEIERQGDYQLTAAYQIGVRLPNSPNRGIGGRPVAVRMNAQLDFS